jgi:hypothetical protein
MKLIESKTLGTAQASVEFTSIPQTFTDLVLLVSARSSLNSNGNIALLPNGATTNISGRFLYGTGAITGSAVTATNGEYNIVTYIANSDDTANTFGNASFYIPNYTSSSAKSFSMNSVSENNGTSASQAITASLWNNTAAITSFTLFPVAGSNLQPSGTFVAGSMFSLYGILKGSDGIVTTS